MGKKVKKAFGDRPGDTIWFALASVVVYLAFKGMSGSNDKGQA